MHKVHKLFILSQCVTLLACQSAFSATPINLRNQPTNIAYGMLASQSFAGTQLKQTEAGVDFNQTKHSRSQQYYKGYPIWGAKAAIHIYKNNSKVKMNGIIYQNLSADLAGTPAYVFNALQADNATQHALDLYKQDKGALPVATRVKNQLMVYVDDKNQAHWAFYISYFVDHKNALPEKPAYILDAVTFAPYKKWNDLKTENTVYMSGYGGNEKTDKITINAFIDRDDETATCYLQNQFVVIKDASSGKVMQFSCKEENAKGFYWDGALDPVNGGYSPSNDSINNGLIVNALYQGLHKIPVLIDENTDNPLQFDMRVHVGMDNAFYDETQNIMVFGDGDESNFYPFTSLDVTAHELSHGFTAQHSGLNYYGQSGGLNESYSDMASKAAEYMVTKSNNWGLGASIMKDNSSPNTAFRYMDNPRHDCVGVARDDQCSINSAKNYYDGLDVHYSSGVFNRAFYLIATSPNWNTKMAFDVMLQANLRYWTPTTNFVEAGCGVMDATEDYGYDTQTIVKAMTAVGVDVSSCGVTPAHQ